MADIAKEIEYHLTYPEPKSYTKEETLSGVIDKDKPPVLILFGWAGCLDRHLVKYSQIYEERGFVTLRYTAPMKVVFWRRDLLTQVGEQAVKTLQEQGLDKNPIFVHCMSNGGAILYVSFICALERLAKHIKVNGIIFDSCPGGANILGFYRAISTMVGGHILYNWPVSTLVTAFLWLLWYFDLAKDYMFSSSPISVDPFKYLRTEKNVCPQLVIYSKADHLVFYKEVEEFAVIRRNKGVNLTTLCFESSPHVKHYATHKEEYIRSVFDFVKKNYKQDEVVVSYGSL